MSFRGLSVLAPTNEWLADSVSIALQQRKRILERLVLTALTLLRSKTQIAYEGFWQRISSLSKGLRHMRHQAVEVAQHLMTI